MSNTNNTVGVMSPEQERLLYDISSKVQNLHTVLFENGFQQRMKKLEIWVDNANTHHVENCPIKPILDARIEKEEKEKEKQEEEQKELRAERREWKMRKGDWLYAAIAIIVAVVASIPAWLTFVIGG